MSESFTDKVEEILGRPIMTHELAFKSVWDEIHEKSKPDFVAICADSERRTE